LPTLLFDSLEMEFHRDRQLLNEVLKHRGLVRHPIYSNVSFAYVAIRWNFIYGNYLWKWISNEKTVIHTNSQKCDNTSMN